jgi:tetratricopeptide (TPR) repeat protein
MFTFPTNNGKSAARYRKAISTFVHFIMISVTGTALLATQGPVSLSANFFACPFIADNSESGPRLSLNYQKRPRDHRPAAHPSTSDDLIRTVKERLLAFTDRRVEGFEWPPTVYIPDDQEMVRFKLGATSINAYAWFDGDTPKIALSRRLMETIVDKNANRLAFCMGHELAHLILRHRLPNPERETTLFLKTALQREDEFAADVLGLELALHAGYLRKPALQGIRRFIDLGLAQTSMHALSTDHPAWQDRLARIDRENARLWSAMSAFENGLFFLSTERYNEAEISFSFVIGEFPESYEAQANLGYAILMRYCESLEPIDLDNFKIGHILVGSFYSRPETLKKRLRGNVTYWQKAVNALEAARSLKSDLALVKANLGIAYLLKPLGRSTQKATQYLRDAAQAAPSDQSLTDTARASIFVNAAVAELAAGGRDASLRYLELADRASPDNEQVAAAVKYNRALILARSDVAAEKRESAALFEEYLRLASPASIWWEFAYNKYRQLAADLDLHVIGKSELARAVKLRPVTSVEVGAGVRISLLDKFDGLNQRLGPARIIPVIPDTDLVRANYAQKGLDILGTKEVLAIFLHGAAAPAIVLQPEGTAAPEQTLKIGMSYEDLRRILGGLPYKMTLDDPKLEYEFYQDLGLAVHYGSDKRIDVLVVTQAAVSVPTFRG